MNMYVTKQAISHHAKRVHVIGNMVMKGIS